MVLKYCKKEYTVIKSLGRRGYMVNHDGYEYRMRHSQVEKAEVVR